LLLDEGKPDAALASITDALAQMVGVHREDRGSVLPAAVTIALAAGQIDRARDALAELESWGKSFNTTAALASVAEARGQVQLANGDAEASITSLREACQMWYEVDAPFEAARARVIIAGALRVGGQGFNATGELEAALSAFERLGALRQAERVRSMLQAARRSRATRALMFTDIVDSTRLVEVLGDDAWGNLLDWHDRTLRQCFNAANGREINHEGDGFFVSFAESLDAVECAIAIQRTLAVHRREHGFAPQVRVGVHATEAVDLGNDYLGKGVHEAARVGAAAGAGEILVTAAVIESVTDHCHIRDRRELHLKGLSVALTVATVEWQ
jgi:class 3 adenylate cyclase